MIKKPLVVPASNGYGLDAWIVAFGNTRTINSGYRDPEQDTNDNSRHLLGDAIDLGNQSGTQDEWNRMVAAAGGVVVSPTSVKLTHTGGNADWIEPQVLPTGKKACGLKCAHADWRNTDYGNYAH